MKLENRIGVNRKSHKIEDRYINAYLQNNPNAKKLDRMDVLLLGQKMVSMAVGYRLRQ